MSPDRDEGDALDALVCWAADEVGGLAEVGPSRDRRPPWGLNATEDVAAYREWWRIHNENGSAAEPTGRLRFTIVVSLVDARTEELRACVESIRRQTVAEWSLVLFGAPTGGAEPDLVSTINPSERINLVDSRTDDAPWTIAGPAMKKSDTAYAVFVDPGVTLHPDALARIDASTGSGVDVIYSDEDEVAPDGSHCRPVFKPDWAPDLLLSSPYLGGVLVVSRSVVEALGESDTDELGNCDYELMLRSTELADRVVHVPHVLFHRRAGSATGLPLSDEGERRALESALARRDLDASVEPSQLPGAWRVRRTIRNAPSVGIVIPFRDQAALLAKCVTSIQGSPGHDNFEIVLVDNGSVEPETAALCTRLAERHGAKVVHYPGAFNWSAINNAGAAASTSEFLLFLNNDIEATGRDWLRALVEQGQRREVGVVGARLLYPDGTLQHAGIVIGTGIIGWHIFMGLPPNETGYLGWDRVVHPYGAVTGACLLTRRDVFDELGGFDESLEVAFNDVDYCLRARDAGYEVVYTPDAVLVHDEAMTRGLSGYRDDGRIFLAKWDRSRLREDPFFNKNLSRFDAWCPLRQPGEDERWEAYVDDLASPRS